MTREQAFRVSAAPTTDSVMPSSGEVREITEAGFVATYLVKRKSEMSFEAFKAHQLEKHVPLALSLPGLIDYRLIFFSPEAGAGFAFDAVAQVSFVSATAYSRAMESREGQLALADLPNMLDMSALRVLTTESDDIHLARGDAG